MAINPDGLDPRFTQEVLTGSVNLTAANTSRVSVAGGNAKKLITFGQYGGIAKRVTAIPSGALAAATKLILFRIRPAVHATDGFMIRSALVAAYATDAATTETPTTSFPYDASSPLRGGPGEEIWASIAAAAANGITVDAEWENF